MRVSELYQNKQPVISMEFFPPRNQAASEKFNGLIDTLSSLDPDYLSITFGAGGSTKDGSYQTVKELMVKKNLPTVAYIAGYGLGQDAIREVLDQYRDLGVETIFVIRGDKPKTDEVPPHPDSFSYASELISFIKSHYDFTLGCAGYPEGHIEAKSLDTDIQYLKQKIENGAEYVVAQYFYDNDYFFNYVKTCKDQGINVPIIPGIMPVYSVKMTRMLSKICGSSLTENLDKKIAALHPEDNEGVIKLGIELATEQCRGLLKKGVPGLHFYTMDRSRSTVEIINQLKQEHLL